MDKKLIQKFWKKGWISAGACALAFILMLQMSWLKWGDLIIDTGRELYLPQAILGGKLLYRDIFYQYGPLSLYWHALLYKFFGVHLLTLVASGILTAIVTGVLVYTLSRIYLSVAYATLATLTYILVFAFGHYVALGNYNFILPYSYPSIHAIACALLAWYLFYLAFVKKKFAHFITGAVIALVWLSRFEIGFVLTGSVVCVLVSAYTHKKGVMPFFIWVVLMPLAFAGAVYAIFFTSAGRAISQSNLFGLWFANANLKDTFTAFHSGAAEFSLNLSLMAKSFGVHLLFCALFVLAGFIIDKNRRRSIAWVAGAIAAAATLMLFNLTCTYDLQYRCLPLWCVLTAAISFLQWARRPEKSELLVLAGLALFSLGVFSRILLHVWAGHYGFYLTVPALIVYYVFLFKTIPELFASAVVRKGLRVGFLLVSVLFIAVHLQIERYCYAQKTLFVASPRGAMRVVPSEENMRVGELIEFVRANTDIRDELIVFPEGLTINFLSGRTNPLYYYSYLPFDLAKPKVSEAIIAQMEERKVPYVALVQRDASEYGAAVFGQDYGKGLGEYIAGHYAVYKQFGPMPFTSGHFGIALFKRKF